MRLIIPYKKENIKIIQNIKQRYSLSELFIKVDKGNIILECERLEIKENDYKDIDKDFIDNVINYIEGIEDKRDYFSIKRTGNNITIEEVKGRRITIPLTVDNTIAIDKLKEKYKELNQYEIVNRLIKAGLNYIDECGFKSKN